MRLAAAETALERDRVRRHATPQSGRTVLVAGADVVKRRCSGWRAAIDRGTRTPVESTSMLDSTGLGSLPLSTPDGDYAAHVTQSASGQRTLDVPHEDAAIGKERASFSTASSVYSQVAVGSHH